ncbi:MAG: inositol monophosphatase, partial [Erythrobacter sp.]|nr:inositol monophosphatase [Erythrobacter sp.]
MDREIQSLLKQVTERAILPRYRNLQQGEVEDKGGNDPVTVADREAEAMLREGLERIDPALAFVGEESTHADPSVARHLGSDCWIVDPLDGTRNFAQGKPPFGVIVAMASGGEARSGWIYDCLSGRFCVAHRGKGAFVDGQRVSAVTTGEAPPVAAISLLFMD